MKKKAYKSLMLLTVLLLSAESLLLISCKESEQEQSVRVPLDSAAPWPKFRSNPQQNGVAGVQPSPNDMSPWTFKTSRGIFSSPVIDGEGNIYIGSADHYFYCLDKFGNTKWSFATGEIIDSSALLDDMGRVYFGSGDQHVYCLDRSNGELIWKFRAHSPEEVEQEFGIETFNVAWFEGNITMLPDGDILAPNDNYLVYRLDRSSGGLVDIFPGNEMVWSAPAVDEKANNIFFGTNYNVLKNVFSYDASTGKKRWSRGGLGTNAASILITDSDDRRGLAIIGGYDGFVRAYSKRSGRRIWRFGTRDHIYSSPAELSDGTLIQASTDGTVYALDPDTGKPVWAFDSPEPIRSSPAVDAADNIYFGSGSGRLFCLGGDGALRWKYKCIDEGRNDLNGSPALGRDGIVIAGENGGVYFVPYDYPLTEAGKRDPRAEAGSGESLPADGSYLLFTTPFGSIEDRKRIEINSNEPLQFSLFIREDGDTLPASLDREDFSALFKNEQDFICEFGPRGTYVTMIPQENWKGNELELSLAGTYRTDRRRLGLFFFGGRKKALSGQNYTIAIKKNGAESVGLNFPDGRGEPASVFEITRLSCPYPTMLPSYNQIGFDSLHYLAGPVEGDQHRALLWVVPGKLDGTSGDTVPAPELEDCFTLEIGNSGGVVTLSNYDYVALRFVGSWDMPFHLFRLAGRADNLARTGEDDFAFNCIADGNDIEFYGRFLKLAGLSDRKTGYINVAGAAKVIDRGTQAPTVLPDNLSVRIFRTDEGVRAELGGYDIFPEDHLVRLLLVDAETGRAVAANYARESKIELDLNGAVSAVSIGTETVSLNRELRAYLMVDTYPAASGLLSRID